MGNLQVGELQVELMCLVLCTSRRMIYDIFNLLFKIFLVWGQTNKHKQQYKDKVTDGQGEHRKTTVCQVYCGFRNRTSTVSISLTLRLYPSYSILYDSILPYIQFGTEMNVNGNYFAACVCRSGARWGHDSCVASCLRKKKEPCICLNNVKKMKGDGKAGASESAACELPQGRRKALHQQKNRERKRK